MKAPKFFKTQAGKKIPLPVFFPDATRAVIKTLDTGDIKNTNTPGILVNTWHLYSGLGKQVIKNHKGIRGFMKWKGGVISDSGGFQVASIAKRESKHKAVNNAGVSFKISAKKKILFTPEESIRFQMVLKPDMLVVLDDFTEQNSSRHEAEETVERTIYWAKRCKEEFEKICRQQKLTNRNRPYLIAVVQGGDYLDLRKECTKRLVEIGFDGLGYGGWPITKEGEFNYEAATVIAENTPDNYFLYGLGIGKPEEIVGCVDLGYTIFDCVLPTRDARHRRLYVFNSENISEIDVRKPKFYSYYTPDKEKHYQDTRPVSACCDCLLCKDYSRSYLAHLFRIEEMTAGRLATIHNLRFYSMLMEKLQGEKRKS